MRKGEDEFNSIITPSFADDDNDSATLAVVLPDMVDKMMYQHG